MSSEKRWFEEVTQMEIAVVVLAILFGIYALSKKIGTMALVYYMQKNEYKLPSDKDLKECTRWVIERMFSK